MNKKLLFSSIGVALLSVVAVHAANGSSVSNLADFLEKNILKFILIDISSNINASFYIWMKVMLFLLLFSLLFALASIGPIANNVLTKKNLRVTVAVLISLISVIMIPNAMVEAIAKTYGFIGSFIFIGLPVLGILYVLYKGFPTGADATDSEGKPLSPGARRVNHIIQGVLFFLLATVIHNFVAASALTPGWSNISGWIEWGSLAEGICTLMMIWHFGAAIFSFGAETETGQEVGDWFRNIGKGGAGNPPYPSHLRRFINQIGSQASKLRADFKEYETIGNRVLIANNAGQPLNQTDFQRMTNLANSFGDIMDQINQNHAHLVNDQQFNDLSAGERIRLANLITNVTITNIHITSYQQSFFINYNARARPNWRRPIIVP